LPTGKPPRKKPLAVTRLTGQPAGRRFCRRYLAVGRVAGSGQRRGRGKTRPRRPRPPRTTGCQAAADAETRVTEKPWRGTTLSARVIGLGDRTRFCHQPTPEPGAIAARRGFHPAGTSTEGDGKQWAVGNPGLAARRHASTGPTVAVSAGLNRDFPHGLGDDLARSLGPDAAVSTSSADGKAPLNLTDGSVKGRATATPVPMSGGENPPLLHTWPVGTASHRRLCGQGGGARMVPAGPQWAVGLAVGATGNVQVVTVTRTGAAGHAQASATGRRAATAPATLGVKVR